MPNSDAVPTMSVMNDCIVAFCNIYMYAHCMNVVIAAASVVNHVEML